ncbi:hypothetical protein NF212_20050 [Parasalinivibrio latis]|uniref:hypothetical protein n=1 Tax=Parasalinivibrio latis TaxID=2952610 RepID=UPI0030DFD2CE
MRRVVCFAIITSVLTLPAFGKSLARFPDDLKTWDVLKQSFVSDSERETPSSATEYCLLPLTDIRHGKDTRLSIQVPNKNWPYFPSLEPDRNGLIVAVELTDIDLILVTELFEGLPLYGTYDLKGNDVSHRHPSIQTDKCILCHR